MTDWLVSKILYLKSPTNVLTVSDHLFRLWFVACSVPSHYLNQYWFLVKRNWRTISGEVDTHPHPQEHTHMHAPMASCSDCLVSSWRNMLHKKLIFSLWYYPLNFTYTCGHAMTSSCSMQIIVQWERFHQWTYCNSQIYLNDETEPHEYHDKPTFNPKQFGTSKQCISQYWWWKYHVNSILKVVTCSLCT